MNKRELVKKRLQKVKEVHLQVSIQEDVYKEVLTSLDHIKSIDFTQNNESKQFVDKNFMLDGLVRKEEQYKKLIELNKELQYEKEELTKYLKKLDKVNCYRVMWYRYILLRSYKEIAEQLDIQVQSVKNIINKSINWLTELEE